MKLYLSERVPVNERKMAPRKMSRGRFPLGGEYTNDAYETSQGPVLEIEITMGVGSVTLETR